MNNLPKEVLDYIFLYNSWYDVIKLIQICKYFRNILVKYSSHRSRYFVIVDNIYHLGEKYGKIIHENIYNFKTCKNNEVHNLSDSNIIIHGFEPMISSRARGIAAPDAILSADSRLST